MRPHRAWDGKRNGAPSISEEEPMTIARRLIILLSVPLLILLALGVFSRFQLQRLERSVRYATETQVKSLATVGNASRLLAEMRIDVRDDLLAREQGQRSEAKAA